MNRLNTSKIKSSVFARATIVFVLLIILIEVFGGFIFRTIMPFGSSYDDAKNPLHRRGWITYTEPRDTVSDYTIVIITNSQGAEPPEAYDELYSNLLEEKLNQSSDKTYTVLNWAMPGARAAEFVVIVTRLIDHDPDLVILSSMGENYVIHESNPIQTYGNDIVRLAAQLPYRNYLSDEFIRRHSLLDPFWILLYNTNIGMLHQFVFDKLDWYQVQRPRRDSLPDVKHHRRQEWDEKALFYVKEIYETYERSVGFDVPFLIGPMPLNQSAFANARYYSNEELINILEKYKPEHDNIFIFNAIEAVDNNLFYDHEHLHLEGHAQYAQYLFDLIQSLPILENAEAQQ